MGSLNPSLFSHGFFTFESPTGIYADPRNAAGGNLVFYHYIVYDPVLVSLQIFLTDMLTMCHVSVESVV